MNGENLKLFCSIRYANIDKIYDRDNFKKVTPNLTILIII